MQTGKLTFPPLVNLGLRTGRLQLRPFQVRDAPFILTIFSDEGFMEYSSAPLFTSMDEAHAVVTRDAARLAAGERLRFGIERMEDGALIGYCDLFGIDRKLGQGEIGYGLLTRERGHGFMNEALSAFLSCVFHQLHFNRVTAEIAPRNTHSEKIVVRLGFTKQAHLRENCFVKGVLSDSFVYGLRKSDLPIRRTP